MAEAERAIVVSGEASVRRAPDLAVVTLAVSLRDREVEPARTKANERASAILEAVRGLGIAETDVSAPSLTVHPVYDYRHGARLTGYEASRPMTIRVRDLAALGPLLDALVERARRRCTARRWSSPSPMPQRTRRSQAPWPRLAVGPWRWPAPRV